MGHNEICFFLLMDDIIQVKNSSQVRSVAFNTQLDERVGMKQTGWINSLSRDMEHIWLNDCADWPNCSSPVWQNESSLKIDQASPADPSALVTLKTFKTTSNAFLKVNTGALGNGGQLLKWANKRDVNQTSGTETTQSGW